MMSGALHSHPSILLLDCRWWKLHGSVPNLRVMDLYCCPSHWAISGPFQSSWTEAIDTSRSGWQLWVATQIERGHISDDFTSYLWGVSAWIWPQRSFLMIADLPSASDIGGETRKYICWSSCPKITQCHCLLGGDVQLSRPVEWTAAALTGQMEDHKPWSLWNKVHTHLVKNYQIWGKIYL